MIDFCNITKKPPPEWATALCSDVARLAGFLQFFQRVGFDVRLNCGFNRLFRLRQPAF